MTTPHTIDAAEMAEFLANHVVEFASATTADRTQRKRISRKGTGLYLVERRYLKAVFEAHAWEPVYSGPDLEEAVRLYNGLG